MFVFPAPETCFSLFQSIIFDTPSTDTGSVGCPETRRPTGSECSPSQSGNPKGWMAAVPIRKEENWLGSRSRENSITKASFARQQVPPGSRKGKGEADGG